MRGCERGWIKRWLRTLSVSSGIVLCGIGGANAQLPVKNPSVLAFQCPDHDRDDSHEIDIVRVADGSVIQTLAGGDPAADAAGEVTIAVNVQPVAFGQYRFVVRAAAGSVKSDDSAPSAIWERTPGKPTGLMVR